METKLILWFAEDSNSVDAPPKVYDMKGKMIELCLVLLLRAKGELRYMHYPTLSITYMT